MAKKWMAKAYPAAHRGELHRNLGVPQGQTIPRAKLRAALSGAHGPEVKRRAEAARTGAKISRNRVLRSKRRERTTARRAAR